MALLTGQCEREHSVQLLVFATATNLFLPYCKTWENPAYNLPDFEAFSPASFTTLKTELKPEDNMRTARQQSGNQGMPEKTRKGLVI